MKHPRNKDRCSYSRTGRYRNRTCYRGFNQLLTLLTIDYALSEACKTFITVCIERWTFWLQRWMTWHWRRICNSLTFDYNIWASFYRNICSKNCTINEFFRWLIVFHIQHHIMSGSVSKITDNCSSWGMHNRNCTCSNVQQAYVPTYLFLKDFHPQYCPLAVV